ncbi:MAG: ABC transporter permease, partial [Planctomycetota bacterium]|nr:ABC transporter permease [Planctomycetota bacterium]
MITLSAMYHFALAWRYTHSRLVNYIAVAAVALCLAVQIVVMAVLDGMLEDMRRRVRDLGEQITVSFLDRELLVAQPSAGLPTVRDLERAEVAVRREIPEVRGLTPLLRGYGVLERRGDFAPAIVFGIDLAREMRYSQLAQHLQAGKIDPEQPAWFSADFPESSLPPMFVGAELAERLGLVAGDEVALG